MRVLIAASGSYGDIYPFVGLARTLCRRGHDVIFFANGNFRPAARAERLEFVAVGTREDYDRVVHDPQLWHARYGLRTVLDAVMRFTPLGYELLLERLRPGQTVVVGSSLAFAARLLQETHDVPLVTVHLAPGVFRSSLDPIRLPDVSVPAAAPAWAKRSLWWLIDRYALDPLIVPPMNEYRASLGLPPVRRIFDTWLHSPDLVLGLFPGWFAPRRADWPQATRLAGFPLYDAAAHERLPDALEDFLEAGPAPVLLAPGTANASAAGFFEASLGGCAKAGRRALLVTRYGDQVPRPLPEWAAHFDYLPFSSVLPRCGAFVNHGGIGSLSQGMRAGIPQLLRPMAFDQFDNAHRAGSLGVARVIPASCYEPGAIAEALEDLGGTAWMESCREAAERLRGEDALAGAAAIIEASVLSSSR